MGITRNDNYISFSLITYNFRFLHRFFCWHKTLVSSDQLYNVIVAKHILQIRCSYNYLGLLMWSNLMSNSNKRSFSIFTYVPNVYVACSYHMLSYLLRYPSHLVNISQSSCDRFRFLSFSFYTKAITQSSIQWEINLDVLRLTDSTWNNEEKLIKMAQNYCR